MPVIACGLGAVPIGMLGLGVLLLVRASTGSFAAAGLASGALSIGNAIGLLVQGRLIDRYGQGRVLVGGAVLCPVALVGLTVAAGRSAPSLALAGLAATAGASIPATTSSMRVLWPRLVSDPGQRATAYSLLATQFQLALVVGPLLVSGLVLHGGPGAAVLVAAGLACVAGLLFAVAPASRRWRPAPAPPVHGGSRRAGAGVRTLLAGAVCGGVTGGMVLVAVPSVTAAQHRPALAGLLFAAFSAGELVAGVGYGARAWRLPASRRLSMAQAGVAASVGCLALVTGRPGAMLAVMFVLGACTAPVSIAGSALLDDVSRGGSLARSYTALVAAGLIGAAAGSPAGGALAGTAGQEAVFLLAAASTAAAAAWTWIRRETLRAPVRRPYA